MIRKSAFLCAVVLSAVVTAGASAQKIEGTYEFPQKAMGTGNEPIDVTARLVLTVKGDSAFGTWQVAIPGRETKTQQLKGTLKGNTVTLNSPVSQAHLQGQDGGNERTIDVTQQYVLTVSGDEISGEISASTTDESVQMPTRSVKGKRVTG